MFIFILSYVKNSKIQMYNKKLFHLFFLEITKRHEKSSLGILLLPFFYVNAHNSPVTQIIIFVFLPSQSLSLLLKKWYLVSSYCSINHKWKCLYYAISMGLM